MEKELVFKRRIDTFRQLAIGFSIIPLFFALILVLPTYIPIITKIWIFLLFGVLPVYMIVWGLKEHLKLTISPKELKVFLSNRWGGYINNWKWDEIENFRINKEKKIIQFDFSKEYLKKKPISFIFINGYMIYDIYQISLQDLLKILKDYKKKYG